MRRPITVVPSRRNWGGVLQSTVWLLVLAVALGNLAVPASAQTGSTGSVAGIVSDPTGAVVPGATVTLTDQSTGRKVTATTTDAGRYVFPNIDPGTYEVAVTKTGFARTSIPGQSVRVGQVATVNAALRLGSSSETVEVQSTANELQVTNSTVGNTVTGAALSSLPSLGRDVSTFLT